MNIGLPTALLNQYYISFWTPFFEKLGLTVITTPETTKSILDKGVRNTAPDLCVPVKIYVGHVVELLDRGADRIYAPRFVSIRGQETFCPKFLALPDLLKSTIPHVREKIITHSIRSTDDNIAMPENYLSLGKLFTRDANSVQKAIREARRTWLNFRDLCRTRHYTCKEANNAVLRGIYPEKNGSREIKIGLIGYVYNVYDQFVSMDVVSRLGDLGADAVTFEMLDDRQLEKPLPGFPKPLAWTFSNKLLAAAYAFLDDPAIDGVIHVTAFGCGPDSFVGKYLELDSVGKRKPFMTIRVDEHTGENHLQTRIEAFVDMISKKKSGTAAGL